MIPNEAFYPAAGLQGPGSVRWSIRRDTNSALSSQQWQALQDVRLDGIKSPLIHTRLVLLDGGDPDEQEE
jgi:hypothetical protein